jgi:hypothetical protein
MPATAVGKMSMPAVVPIGNDGAIHRHTHQTFKIEGVPTLQFADGHVAQI